jgi:coenzyme F420 biosynthesis associated uncharacterized protein
VTLIDWGLAERLALTIGGSASGTAARGPFDHAAIQDASAEAVEMVRDYTGLEPASDLPPAEAVDRAEWSRTGLGTLRELSEDLEDRIAGGITLPGPLGSIARSVAGAAAATEAGVAVGYASRRVLGQFDLSLVTERPPRLLFVAPNLAEAHRELGEEPEVFLLWIAIHEQTHAFQFTAVPWLRDHLAGLVDDLLRAASEGLDRGALGGIARRLLTSDPRETVRAILRGELPRLLAGPEQAATIDRLQATMAVVEGYAEHVMDAAGAGRRPAFERLRARMDARRAGRGGLGEAIARVLGLELKLRQYAVGRRFCEAVAEAGGIEALNLVWSSPDALPSPSDLDRPRDWLRRARDMSLEPATRI